MKFHSAEHAVINAYYDLKRIPDYKELRFYSNYSYDCGTLLFAPKLTVFLGFALIHLFLPWLWLIPGHIAIILICMLLYKENKLYFLESLVLIQPTSKEYKVALAALGIELERAVMFEDDVEDICCWNPSRNNFLWKRKTRPIYRACFSFLLNLKKIITSVKIFLFRGDNLNLNIFRKNRGF